MREKEPDPGKWGKCCCGATQCTRYMNEEDKNAKKPSEIQVS
jgi:hypothetical protein